MARKDCRKGFVEIPQMTLNALKGLLFGKEGVDLSAIINDLKPNENDELTAINVGLVYKGLTPEIDKTTRFTNEWETLVKWEFVGISLILGVVKIKVWRSHFINSTNKFQEWETSGDVVVKGFDEWLEASTNEEEIRSKIIEKYGTKEEPKPQTF